MSSGLSRPLQIEGHTENGPPYAGGPLELFGYGGDHPRADGATTLTDGEPQALVHGDRLDQLDLHLGVLARGDELAPLGQLHDAGYVGRAEVELRAIAGDERRV